MNKITVQNLPLNPNYILREDPRQLPKHIKATDLKPFTIIVCQSKVLSEAYDAMVVKVGPGKLRALDRFGVLRTIRFGDILDITRRPVMFEDEGVEDIFPMETAIVEAASPTRLLARLHDASYPCVLRPAPGVGGWQLCNLGPSDHSIRIPDETAYAVGYSLEVYHTEVEVRGTVNLGIVSRINGAIGEAIVWTPKSLASFIEEQPSARLIDMSYEYVEATLIVDTNLGSAGFTNWSVDRDDAIEVARLNNFVSTDVKEPDAPPRHVVAHHSHPSLDYAIEFKRLQIPVPKPAVKNRLPKKKAAKKAAVKKVASKSKAAPGRKTSKKIYSSSMKVG